MTPFNDGLYKTLHLLVMLCTTSKKKLPQPSPEDLAVLKISRQVLRDAGLTVPELVNYLQWLGDRGYTEHLVVFDDYVREHIDQAVNGESGQKIEQALKESDNKDKTGEINKAVIQYLRPKVAPGDELDEQAIITEKLSRAELSGHGLSLYKSLRPDEIALVILLPFRDIERLYERVGTGEDPKDIKDDGVWYDTEKCEFHLGEDIVPTSYQGKHNNEHYVLMHFEQGKKTGQIWFDDIDGFRPDSLRHAMNRFVKKHPRLRSMFSVHSDRVEVFTGRLQ